MIISKRFSAESQLYYRNVTFFVQTLPPQHKQKNRPSSLTGAVFCFWPLSAKKEADQKVSPF